MARPGRRPDPVSRRRCRRRSPTGRGPPSASPTPTRPAPQRSPAAGARRPLVDRFTGEVTMVDPRSTPRPHPRRPQRSGHRRVRRRRAVRSRPTSCASTTRTRHRRATTDVIAYCGSGVSACANVLALEHAGLAPARLYVASWSGWSADPERPRGARHVSDDPSRSERCAPETQAMVALRRTRQRHRLGNLEWFEAAYRVVHPRPVRRRGRAVAQRSRRRQPVSAPPRPHRRPATARRCSGCSPSRALAAGLRSGAQGGPLALEAPDVAYVMLSPVDRRRALLRPAVQRLRSAALPRRR